MEILKIDLGTFKKLYNLFKDNNSFILKEDEKYEKGVKEILNLDNLNKVELQNIRNKFVETIYNIVQVLKYLSFVQNYDNIHNVLINMLQYVTTEIDIAKIKVGGEV